MGNNDKLVAALYEYQEVEFLPLSKLEAILFVKATKDITDEEALPLLKQLKPYTGYNPYLLTYTLKYATLDAAYAACYWVTVRYIQRTLPAQENK